MRATVRVVGHHQMQFGSRTTWPYRLQASEVVVIHGNHKIEGMKIGAGHFAGPQMFDLHVKLHGRFNRTWIWWVADVVTVGAG